MKFYSLLQSAAPFAALSGASPLPNTGDPKPHHKAPNSPDEIVKAGNGVSAVKSRVMRFGIELEQFVNIPKTSKFGAAFHKAADARLQSKSGKDARLSHTEVVDLLANMLVEEWSGWDERRDAAFYNLNQWTRKYYKRHGLCNAVNEDNKCNPLQEWTVVLDTSLSSSTDELATLSRIGVEFVSPVMYVGPDDYWYKPARYSIEMFYYFLTERCGLELVQDHPGWPKKDKDLEVPRTSTHVHISPPQASPDEENPEEWTLQRAQLMAQSVLFWEPAVRALLPKDRWANGFAREFRDSHLSGHWKVWPFNDDNGVQGDEDVLNEVLGKIQATASMDDLKKLMNPGPDHSFQRQFGWNFLNLPSESDQNKKGSLEFRRGGQSMNAATAAKYMELVTGMALAACSSGDQLMVDFHDGQDLKVGELYKFIDSAISTRPTLAGGEVMKSAFKAGWTYPELVKTFGGAIRNRPVSDFKVLKYPPLLYVWVHGELEGVQVQEESAGELLLENAMSSTSQLSPVQAMGPSGGAEGNAMTLEFN